MRGKLILAVLLVVFLAGCGREKEPETVPDATYPVEAEPVSDDAYPVEAVADEINQNSTLPAKLLERVELSEREKGRFGMDRPYYDDRSGDGIDVLGFPYPEYNSAEISITQMDVTSEQYDVLGLTVGDRYEKTADTMQKYDFAPVETDAEGRLQYKKGDVSVIVYFREERIERLVVSVKVYVPEGVMF